MQYVNSKAHWPAARLRPRLALAIILFAAGVGALAFWHYPGWRLNQALRTLSDIGATIVEVDTGTVIVADDITGTLSTDDLVWLEPVRLRISNVGSPDLLDLEALPSLQSLEITGNVALTTLPELRGLANLEELTITRNGALTTLPELQGLASLERLTIIDNGALTTLPALQGLANLEELTITRNVALATLPELRGLVSLEWLSISGGEALTALPALRGLPQPSIALCRRQRVASGSTRTAGAGEP